MSWVNLYFYYFRLLPAFNSKSIGRYYTRITDKQLYSSKALQFYVRSIIFSTVGPKSFNNWMCSRVGIKSDVPNYLKRQKKKKLEYHRLRLNLFRKHSFFLLSENYFRITVPLLLVCLQINTFCSFIVIIFLSTIFTFFFF